MARAFSAPAITAAELDRSQVFNLRDLAARTPGLFVGGDDNFGGSPVGVGYYVDGVYQGKPFAEPFDFISVDSVEVLRGPQGTLYGRNATGALIDGTLYRKLAVGDATREGYSYNGLTGARLNGTRSNLASGALHWTQGRLPTRNFKAPPSTLPLH